jgi:dimeric dUTPase (all-alpha-NTP-PPase superfamily)
LNLNELFEIQAKLDAHIEKEHPRQPGEDRLAKKILALQVELGELANELPEVFKFWSNKKNNYEKALEELVDCLHFILSIGLELELTDFHINHSTVKNMQMNGSLLKKFSRVFAYVYKVERHKDHFWYDTLLESFIGLGFSLGFTWREIEQAYLAKNKINHQRQESGY